MSIYFYGISYFISENFNFYSFETLNSMEQLLNFSKEEISALKTKFKYPKY